MNIMDFNFTKNCKKKNHEKTPNFFRETMFVNQQVAAVNTTVAATMPKNVKS